MNNFLNGLVNNTNYTLTENGALTHKTTKSDLYDMFAFGGAMRTRSEDDVVLLFANAYKENPLYALKCLFYLRDIEHGQGERRFFRVVLKYLANNYPDSIRKNIIHIPEYGRWDDLYSFVGTPCEKDAFDVLKKQLVLDISSKTPSLMAKWLKSENTSSKESRNLGYITRRYFHMTSKQYRKTLSVLRQRINVLERLMSERRWAEIEFDKIPSRAGMIYKNAFAKHDVDRIMENAISYANFMADKNTAVNAKALYPYECVAKVLDIVECDYFRYMSNGYKFKDNATTDRDVINKYWDNLTDYFNGASFNGIAIVDTSGSMINNRASAPINVAISLGLYCADKANGPFKNYFINFSDYPHLIRTDGVDFCDKVRRMLSAPWGGSTNVESAFDLLLKTALENHCSQEEIPQNLIIISDMEFNSCVTSNDIGRSNDTLFEKIKKKWASYGYEMPHLIFWNVEARQNNIPITDSENVSYVSGMSPAIFESVMTGKSGYDLMMDTLNSERYKNIVI